MHSSFKAVAFVSALALVCAGCPGGSAAEDGDAAVGEQQTAPPAPPPPSAAPAASEPPDTSAAQVVIRYEHIRTCGRFMGRAGQYFAYRIASVRNGGSAPFTLQPELFRFGGGGGAGSAPLFRVPEFSDLEVAAGATEPSTDLYLLQRDVPGPPPHGAVPLGYEAPGVAMVREGGEPEYDEGTGCDEFNT